MEGGRGEVTMKLEGSLGMAEEAQWAGQSIYRVPPHIRNLNPNAYKPQVVSFGPFHHGDPDLLHMEEHKHRALRHVLHRAGKTVRELVAALEGVAEQLERAYKDLAVEWRGPLNRPRFLELMVTDGCFMLEVVRTASKNGTHIQGYAPSDPIFSHHGILYTIPYIKRDMLMMENQLPLVVLQRIVAARGINHSSGDDYSINSMVLNFLSPHSETQPPGVGLRHHPLDVRRRSMLFSPEEAVEIATSSEDVQQVRKKNVIQSAVDLHDAGIRFKSIDGVDGFKDITFEGHVLSMPEITVDESTEYILLNMMALERLHVGAQNIVTAYVFFLYNIISSAKDVALLRREKIIYNNMASDEEAAKMFNRISKDIVIEEVDALAEVYWKLNDHYDKYLYRTLNMWWHKLVDKYFQNPWTTISLIAATVVLVLTVVQTWYAVLDFYQRK